MNTRWNCLFPCSPARFHAPCEARKWKKQKSENAKRSEPNIGQIPSRTDPKPALVSQLILACRNLLATEMIVAQFEMAVDFLKILSLDSNLERY